MDIVKCSACDAEYEGAATKGTRKCPSCGSDEWVHVRTIEGKEPCPHCGHSYHWRTFTACPQCDLPRNAPVGSVAPQSDEARRQVVAAVAALPTEQRIERLLQEMLAEQQRTRRSVDGIRWGVIGLFVWLVVIPVVVFLLVR